MKISFNTRDVTRSELYVILDLIHELIDEKALTPKVNELKNSPSSNGEFTITGTSAPDSFTTLDPNERFVPSGPVTDALVEIVKKQVVDSLKSPTSEEYEPDDEGDSSGADRVYFVSPETVTNLTLTNVGKHPITVIEPGETATVSVPVVPPPPVAAIAQVLPLPPQPETVITVTPPPPPGQPESIPQGSASYVDPYDSQPGDLDSDGSPWDATIHSESRAKNVDGTWRKRRVNKNVEVKAAIAGLENITPNSVPAPPAARPMVRTFVYVDGAQDFISAPKDATDAELSAITGKPTTRHAGPRLMPVEADTFLGTSGSAQVAPSPPMVPPPPPAAPPVVKTAAPGAPAGTWPELMERVTKYFGAQKITSVDLAEICKTFNIGSVQECFTQPHLIPLVSSAIDAKAATK